MMVEEMDRVLGSGTIAAKHSQSAETEMTKLAYDCKRVEFHNLDFQLQKWFFVGLD